VDEIKIERENLSGKTINQLMDLWSRRMRMTRKQWVNLNRFRTGKLGCNDLMYTWKLYDSAKCD